MMTDEFKSQMGDGNPDGPCQWVLSEKLDDVEFYGRWRGWIEQAPDEFDPPVWHATAIARFVDHIRDVTPIPPPPCCEWKTGPMPGVGE
jgi:hypothetical protein